MNTEINTIINLTSLNKFTDRLYCVSEDLFDNRLKYYQLQAKAVEADFF
jgi:hypothetical protein